MSRSKKWYKHYHRFAYWWIKSRSSKDVYRVLCIRRSGQHAIINWLQNQISGTICFYNNAYPEQPIFDSCNNKESKLRFLQKGNTLMYNIENPRFNRVDVFGEGRFKERKDVLIIRDPYNCFASYLNANWEWDTNFQDKEEHRNIIKALWKTHAREVLGETNVLPNKYAINYNRWVTDKSYRASIAQDLGFVFTDQGVDQTPHYGKGSSFDADAGDFLADGRSLRMMSVISKFSRVTMN